MAMVTMTMEEAKKIMTPERRRREIVEARKLPFVYDPECPPMTEAQLNKFHRAKPRHKAC